MKSTFLISSLPLLAVLSSLNSASAEVYQCSGEGLSHISVFASADGGPDVARDPKALRALFAMNGSSAIAFTNAGGKFSAIEGLNSSINRADDSDQVTVEFTPVVGKINWREEGGCFTIRGSNYAFHISGTGNSYVTITPNLVFRYKKSHPCNTPVAMVAPQELSCKAL